MKLCQFVPKILRGNEILMSVKGHSCVTNLLKLTCNNPYLDLVNANGYTKFSESLSICSEDIEWKRNSDKKVKNDR